MPHQAERRKAQSFVMRHAERCDGKVKNCLHVNRKSELHTGNYAFVPDRVPFSVPFPFPGTGGREGEREREIEGEGERERERDKKKEREPHQAERKKEPSFRMRPMPIMRSAVTPVYTCTSRPHYYQSRPDYYQSRPDYNQSRPDWYQSRPNHVQIVTSHVQTTCG